MLASRLAAAMLIKGDGGTGGLREGPRLDWGGGGRYFLAEPRNPGDGRSQSSRIG